MGQDEVATVRTLIGHREALGALIAEHRGRVVDAPGDNLLAEFASALDAVRCAAQCQHTLRTRNAELPPNRKMEFRIGVHLGDLMVEGGRLYGDGVNIAARLEGVAEPGGICISGAVHDQVRNKLADACEDLGEQSLKNIDHPVRVFRVRADGAAPTEADMELSVPGFAGRPAIAVLPFDNMSGDPEQEYLADGIAEDLLTRLSLWRHFPVIARNSSFVYKGQAVDVKRVSRELGVRYVLEGSVRRAGPRVRVSAQLIDASSGHHVWAERYDRDLDDVFALQDEITEAIVSSLHPELLQFESDRAVYREPSSLDAWESAHRGWGFWHHLNQKGNVEARRLLERAVELDPHFSWAYAALAHVHYVDLFFQWSESPERSMIEMFDAAQRSVKLDEKDAFGQLALGVAYSLTPEQDKMMAAAHRALQLNPSLPLAYEVVGAALIITGKPDEGIATVEKGIRLSPNDPLMFDFLMCIALGHFAAGRYQDSVDWAQRSIERRSDYPPATSTLAAALARLGRLDEARRAFQEATRDRPLSKEIAELTLSSATPELRENFIDALRLAGMED
jgi:adenylate cyclase